MTTSPDTQPERSFPKYTQRDFANRPNDSRAQSPLVKVLWISLVVAFGIAGIYLAAVLFAALVGLATDNRPTDPTPAQQTQEAPTTPPTSE